jgi:probable HAF family extracellular repeat protein
VRRLLFWITAVLAVSLAAVLSAPAPARQPVPSDFRIRDVGSLGAGMSTSWKILVLIYGRTDQSWTDSAGVSHHVIAQMTQAEKDAAADSARQFVEADIPRLTSGAMVPSVTVRFPTRTLTNLQPEPGGGFSPSPSNTAPERDPAFDSVIVIWDPRGMSQLTGQPEWIGAAAGLAYPMGIGQTYEAQIIESIFYGSRNVLKHEFGHSILWYFDASGQAPKPAVDNHTEATTYVHCPTGRHYVWQDETLANPIPNSIYNDDSGFTHDYYSGTTALAAEPSRCLGITHQAWELGGPVTAGPLSGTSEGTGIDDRGRIVGSTATVTSIGARGETHAFLAQSGTLSDIGGPGQNGSSYASAIATRGRDRLIAGASAFGSACCTATLWKRNQIVDLGTMGRSAVTSWATDVNRQGQVVGQIGIDSELFHPFLWQDGVMTDLGSLPDPYGGSGVAEGINDRGEIVGWSGDLAPHPFLWQQGRMRDLGTLGGSGGRADAINDHGDVAGESQTASGDQHAFLWRAKTAAMIDLGTLGGATSVAYGINDRGQIVGESTTAGGETHAFVWQHGAMRDLGTLGGSYSSAADINSKGKIAGSSIDSLGRKRAALWSPR